MMMMSIMIITIIMLLYVYICMFAPLWIERHIIFTLLYLHNGIFNVKSAHSLNHSLSLPQIVVFRLFSSNLHPQIPANSLAQTKKKQQPTTKCYVNFLLHILRHRQYYYCEY